MRKNVRTRKQRVAAAGAGAGVLAVVATGAFAYYASQTATAEATTGDKGNITITGVSAPTGLIPGGAVKDITVGLKNETQETITLKGVNVVIAKGFKVQPDATKKACTDKDFTILNPTDNGPLASGQEYSVTAKIQMVNNDYDQANCKGVAIPLEVTLVP